MRVLVLDNTVMEFNRWVVGLPVSLTSIGGFISGELAEYSLPRH